jgi:hypothetical protein
MSTFKTSLAMTGAFCPSLLAQYEDSKKMNGVQMDPLQAGYNASEKDLFITGNYIYWDWKQESLLLGQNTKESKEKLPSTISLKKETKHG